MVCAVALQGLWRSVQAVLVASLLVATSGIFEEYSLRRYLNGFSDAVVPLTASSEQKVEAILLWMGSGPARRAGTPDDFMGNRDPKDTLNYGQLLNVCGTATNAFINLALSSGLQARRLLLLDSQRGAKHVVAEVRINGRWVVADPSLRILFRDVAGRLVTREQLRDPAILAEVTRNIQNYPANYTYESTAHVRLARIPFVGKYLRRILDKTVPGWEEAINWTMPLERWSLGLTVLALMSATICLVVHLFLSWHSRSRLRIESIGITGRLQRLGKALFRLES